MEAWLADRRTHAEKVARPKEPAKPVDPVKAAAQAAQRTQRRSARAREGVDELNLWLHDMLREGLAELPRRPQAFISTVKKSVASSWAACWRTNSRQLVRLRRGAGGMRCPFSAAKNAYRSRWFTCDRQDSPPSVRMPMQPAGSLQVGQSGGGLRAWPYSVARGL